MTVIRKFPRRIVFPKGEEPKVLSLTQPISCLLFLLANATVFLRPTELIPSIEDWPIYEVLIAGSLLSIAPALSNRMSPDVLRQQPITVCAIGVVLAIFLSHFTHFSFGDARDGTVMFAKVFIYYFLGVCIIDTPIRMRALISTTAICTVAMVGLCITEFFGYVDFPGIEHLIDHEIDDEGNRIPFIRMRGTGLFQDPNDISLMIIVASILCVYLTTDKTLGWLRYVCPAGICVLLTGLVCTKSRGGLLAAGVSVIVYVMIRYGRMWSFAIGIAGMIGILFLGGRQADIDLDDGTGQERIQLWAEGLDELKSTSLVFGIGQGLYADSMGYVAHNSFVHSYVELGLFGGTLFLGMYFFAFRGIWSYARHRYLLARFPEFSRLAPYVAASLAGWTAGLFSLSRCYVVPNYTILMLVATYVSIANRIDPRRRISIIFDRSNLLILCYTSIGVLMFIYLFVKVMLRG